MNRLLLIIVSFCFFSVKAISQAGLCPSNLNFEQGDFTGWQCRAGTTASTPPLPLTGPLPGRHTIISAATGGTDPFGFFPELCPNGSGYSIKLGNHGINREVESVSYTYTIPAGLSIFSMLIYYAVVIESPGHTELNQPRFQARIIDVTTGTPIPCVNFDFIAQNTPGGFRPSPIPGNGGSPVLYKDWTPISINLNAYIGRTIQLEFVTKDCSQGGHAGYAYIDVGTSCNGAITGNYICPGNSSITLNAPFGFQNYTWYADNTFTTVLSTTQTLMLNPPPPAGTVYPIVVDPFPGFGCKDTLYANVQIAPPPVSNAGPDASTCNNTSLQIGTASLPGLSYQWTPAAYVSNPLVSNPFVFPPTGAPTEFIVTTTDILTGCTSQDTTYITGLQADTAIAVTGKTSYCTGDPAAGTLTVSNTLSAVQWYDGNTPIAGATGFSYQPTASGNYWAQVQELGCTDSTRITAFVINPPPISIAGPDVNLCINQSVQIGTTSNPAYTYTWTPAAQVSNAAVSDPQAWVVGATAQEFIVHTVDPLTGCNSYDTTIITGLAMDTLITLTGKNDYCVGDPASGALSVNNSLQSVQWYDGTTPIPGATGFTYQPVATGNFWAQLQQAGCTDSTLIIPFGVHAIPVAAFMPDSDSACITNNSFTFNNLSNSSDGAALSYLWKFSDGTRQTIPDAVKSFTLPGSYTVRLITTTSFGCVDSTGNTTVHVMGNGKPDFTWDSICINRPVQFYNTSRENGSPQVNYNWNFNNGGPGYLIKTPPPVTYTAPGTIDVTLKLVTLGCENFPDSVVRKVQVNKPKDGIRYRDRTLPERATDYLHVRDSVGTIFLWQPRVQLSDYNSRYTKFTAIDDVRYYIQITDPHTCITVDTMQLLVLKKRGYYLPTAFTPNGDGLNDVARPYLVGMKQLKSFSIFNRWGALLFYSNKEGEGWNGKYKGVDQNTGVYVWILEFIDNNDKKVTEKGTITVIR